MTNNSKQKNGFFDLQVNGYAGIDFNKCDITTENLHRACSRLKKDGASGILATIFTAEKNEMTACLKRIVQARENDPLVKEIICGFHIEGPFLLPELGYCGAHPINFMIPAKEDVINELLDAADGLTRIVTLAPEVDKNNRVTEKLVANGIVVAAGHCNPTSDQLKSAIDSGLSMFTHLGNGCPNILPRHDNILQRVLSLRDKLWITFIADGIHIPFFALKNYLSLVGVDKSIIVSDAIAAAGAKPGIYTMGHTEIKIESDGISQLANKSSLAGSTADLQTIKQNLITHIGLSKQQMLQLTSVNPKRAIGLVEAK
jgi:N-acetylglucosamine-6-phosphate deacetylase